MQRAKLSSEYYSSNSLDINSSDVSIQKAALDARIREIKDELPHLYAHNEKWYSWSRAFFESRNKMNLLTAANQIGKSTVAIRKNIEWAGNPKLWPELWPTPPIQFWYFYPSVSQINSEFATKWVTEYLPRGSAKKHKTYGWTEEIVDSCVVAIHFNSGCSIYFKSYSQKSEVLQSSTVHMITADEEMREDLVDEVLVRLRATQGYFNQVFTATQGYQLWFRAMECQDTSEEAFRGAFKQQVSMYDCLTYDDGSPGFYTTQMIQDAISTCTTKNEELKRIWGRFVKDEGIKYFGFSIDKNIKPKTEYPPDWDFYCGVDIGSGGNASKKRSMASIVFILVSPKKDKGRVVAVWRGDGQETSSGDILKRYQEMRAELGRQPMAACYDYQSREFGITASRSKEPFIAADKRRDAGEKTVNDLFLSNALTIDEGIPDIQKLITELVSVPAASKAITRKYVDDLVDALRYAVFQVPWDMAAINPEILAKEAKPEPAWTESSFDEYQLKLRRGLIIDENEFTDGDDLSAYIAELNSYYGD